MKRYLFDYQNLLGKEGKRLDESEISDHNKQLIHDFKNHNLAKGTSLPRVLRHLHTLRFLAIRLNKDLELATTKDIESYLVWLQEKQYALESILTFKAICKVFYKWINKGTYPECVSWLKLTSKNRSQILPDELLTPEEVKNLILATRNQRDRAMISMLWESGARVSEIGTLQIRNVQFDEYGCQVTLDGKTGMRRIRLVSSAPDLMDWLNVHPSHDNPDSYIWLNLNNLRKPMEYRAIGTMIEKVGRRAGIKKPLNPHHFRHSRATFMSQHLTEAQMKEYFGWTQDSRMAARYIHLSGKQVDDAILRFNGLKKGEPMVNPMKIEACPRCKTINSTISHYCKQCWLPLDSKAITEVDKIPQMDEQGMNVLMKLFEITSKDPIKLKAMVNLIEQAGGGQI